MSKFITKKQTVINIMTENVDKPMAEVVPMIMEACEIEEWLARLYYSQRVAADPTLGKIERKIRAKKVKPETETETKPVKVKAPKMVKAVRVLLDEKPLITNEMVEEIKDKAAKRSKKKSKATGPSATPTTEGVENFNPDAARAYVDAVTDDIDNFEAPSSISREDLTALI